MFRTHANDAAVHVEGEAKASSGKGNSLLAVQHFYEDFSRSDGLNSSAPGIVLDSLDYVRFWSNIATLQDIEACWLWRGGFNSSGYGSFSLKGKLLIASRVAYQLAHGAIPQGLIVRHSCDNPPCCNPRHLLTGTTMDNAIDRAIRGRTNRGRDVWHKVRLTEADVLRIRAAPQTEWPALAKELDVSRNTVFSAATGQSWKHLPNAVKMPGRQAWLRLTAEKVSYIRTCSLSDAHLARVFGVSDVVIRLARTGKTWADVGTPPDTAPRESGGARQRPIEARARTRL